MKDKEDWEDYAKYLAGIESKLLEPLDRDLVMSRDVGGSKVEYIAGHAVIRNANKLFGFGGWGYTLTQLILTPCPDNKNGNKVVSGQAVVKVAALGCKREDVGYGEGIARSLPAANESAGKEAVTDALKRALRAFGDQFGNGLYDKRFEHVWTPEPEDETLDKISACKTVEEITKLYKRIPANEQMRYVSACKKAKEALLGGKK